MKGLIALTLLSLAPAAIATPATAVQATPEIHLQCGGAERFMRSDEQIGGEFTVELKVTPETVFRLADGEYLDLRKRSSSPDLYKTIVDNYSLGERVIKLHAQHWLTGVDGYRQMEENVLSIDRHSGKISWTTAYRTLGRMQTEFSLIKSGTCERIEPTKAKF